MGISLNVAHCLAETWRNGGFEGCQSVMELGPQDLSVIDRAKRPFDRFIADRFGADNVKTFAERAYRPDGQFSPDAAKTLYGFMGLIEYVSTDLLDSRSEYRFDLNKAVKIDRQFDVVTDLGTSEHIFNIGQNLANAHALLRKGGTLLLLLPTMGGYNHGFYNINSVLFRSLAHFNGYEILRLDYMASSEICCRKMERELRMPSFPTFQDIRQSDPKWMSLSFYALDIYAYMRYRDRCSALIFAALRKTGDAPFVIPQQINKYANTPAVKP